MIYYKKEKSNEFQATFHLVLSLTWINRRHFEKINSDPRNFIWSAPYMYDVLPRAACVNVKTSQIKYLWIESEEWHPLALKYIWKSPKSLLLFKDF